MAIKAAKYRDWCVENISPQSWARLCLKSIDVVRKENISIKSIQNPDEQLELSSELFESLNESLLELYEMKMEENLISAS